MENKTSTKGKFITIEGCEGSGKTRQINMLRDRLESLGVDYVATREPGGTGISEKIRNILLDGKNREMDDVCEALLYAAARVQHINEVILPALKEGKLVICDRYIDSSFAYQGYARGLGYGFIREINRFAIERCMPDATVFLNLSPEDAFKRKGGADAGDRVEMSGKQFHDKVYSGYLELVKMFPERIIDVDCRGTKEETSDKIFSALKAVKII